MRGLQADQPLRVVALGGGTGLAALLGALKPESAREVNPWKLTGVVTVADDGGSSGRIRAELGGIPPGDLRNCLAAMTQRESVLSDLLNYRFKGEGPLGGHSLGNLMLLAMADIAGSWVRAIRQLSGVLVTSGRLYPSTLASVTLCAEDLAGNRLIGESAVNTCTPPLARLWLEPRQPEPLPEALLAILQADVILLAPGSLYTSTAANLLIPELRSALASARAPRIYVANLMTQPGESLGLSLEDHVATLQAFGHLALDAVIANSMPPPDDMLVRYRDEGGEPLVTDRQTLCGVQVHSRPLLDPGASSARHAPSQLNQAIRDVLESL